uniref:Myosin light chain 6B n=1 Tax=Molossus molossus TaxID=27622 RepID=A0A7J8FZX6_MOLMO|nr:myosin light chain 6B [Molossus molossus]
MPPKKDVPVKKPAGPSISKPAAKPAAGAPPAKTKAEPAAAVPSAPEKTWEPPIDLSKVVIQFNKDQLEGEEKLVPRAPLFRPKPLVRFSFYSPNYSPDYEISHTSPLCPLFCP